MTTLDPTWLDLRFPEHYNNTQDRVQVDPRLRAERTGVVVMWGQSEADNNVNAAHVVRHPDRLHNLSLANGGVYEAKDPLLSGRHSFDNWGSVGSRLGDLMLDAEWYDRLILFPTAVGGSSVSQWAHNGLLEHRIWAAGNRLRAHGYVASFIVTILGETDALFSVPKDLFKALVLQARASFDAEGITAPMIMALSTFMNGDLPPGSTMIRQAITELADENETIVLGPDLDVIGADKRHDATHFNGAGADLAAQKFFDVLVEYRAAH